jgi:hypothetical protein
VAPRRTIILSGSAVELARVFAGLREEVFVLPGTPYVSARAGKCFSGGKQKTGNTKITKITMINFFVIFVIS